MAKETNEKKTVEHPFAESHSERKHVIGELEGLGRTWANVGSQATRQLIEEKMAKLLGQI